MARALPTVVVLLVLAVPLMAGCLEERTPARSIPLENVAPRPPPAGVGQVVLVEYDLHEFRVATRFTGDWHEDVAAAALRDMGYAQAEEGVWVQARSDGGDGGADAADEAAREAARIELAHEPEGPAGVFWFNVTYPGVELGAPTQSDAEALADEEWREREPHLLATLAAFEQRTDWRPEGAPALTYMFVADMRSEP